jgi:hypothetical protein
MRSRAICQVRDCQPECQLSRCKAKPFCLASHVPTDDTLRKTVEA